MKKLTHEERQAHGRPKKADASAACLPAGPTRAIVTVPIRKGAEAQTRPAAKLSDASERLSEAAGLAKAIGLEVRFAGTVPLTQPRPATLFGSGKVEEIGAIVTAEEAEVVIVDHALSPIQQRNLEKAWNAKVLDRTGLILEIFGERAQSKAGRLQVELARLTYQKSRLVRSWTHLERQRGGFGFLGGPGETQIEADRRAIAERIDTIKGELGVVERTRGLHRKRRKQTQQQVVSLVGYTNAGKSTLFNALTGAGRARPGYAVRNARSDAAPREIPGRRNLHPVGHGGLCLRTAAAAHRGLPFDARRNARSRSDPACARHRLAVVGGAVRRGREGFERDRH